MADSTTTPVASHDAAAPALAGEKVAQASNRLAGAAAAAAEKKSRGRPATPGSVHSQFKSPGVKLAPGEKSGAARSDLPPFRPGVVERAVNSMLSVCDRTVKRRVHTTALILTKNKGMADEFSSEVEMSEEERKDISALAEAVCLQYSLMGQHAPAVLLATHLAFYGGRVAMTMHQLNQIAEFNRRQGNKPASGPAGQPVGEAAQP